MSKLLLATDGSDPSRRAENHLTESYPTDTEIIVTAIADIPNIISGYFHADQYQGMTPEEAREDFREQARRIAEVSADRLEESGYSVQVLTDLGNPGPEICRIADEQNVDGIILARKGHGAIGEFLLGSVSNYVLHHAPCAVTLVPDK